MTNELAAFAAVMATVLLTYWLHSTVAIGLVWLVTRGRASSTLHDRLWKFAAVVGLVTAPIQIVAASTFSTAVQSAGVQLADDLAMQHEPAPRGSVAVAARSADTRSETFAAPGHAAIETVAEPMAAGDDLSAHEFGAISSLPFPSEDGGALAFLAPMESPARNPQPVAIGTTTSLVTAEDWRAVLSTLCLGLAFLPVLTLTFGGLLLAVRTYAFRRRIQSARPMKGPARGQLDQLLVACGIRRPVALIASDHYAEPVAFGALHWTIVLPKGIDKRLDAVEVRALLAHELAHLVRGDTVWLWFGQWLCLCLPFQPLNFLARRRWQSASEFLCDAWATEAGVNGLTLAKCLTRIAEWSVQSRCQVSLAASGDAVSTVARVQRLVGPAEYDVWQTRIGLVGTRLGMLLTFAAIMLLTPALRIPSIGEETSGARSRTLAAPLVPADADNDSVGEVGQMDRLFQGLDSDIQDLASAARQTELNSEERELVASIRQRSRALQQLRGGLGSSQDWNELRSDNRQENE